MAYSQNTRTAGGTNRPEYRPTVKLSGTGNQFIRFRTFEDIDLSTQYLSFENIQGGNRVSTSRDPSFQKADSAYFNYSLTPRDSSSSFSSSWSGFGVHPAMWDLGDSGNWKLWNEDDGSTVPAGEYVVSISPDWRAGAIANPVLKEMTIRVSSPVKCAMEQMDNDKAVLASSAGTAKIDLANNSCPAYGSRNLGTGKTLA